MRLWGKLEIRYLQNRCLVELDGENKIQMHDHIRDMGRLIAKEGSMPLRLWDHTINSIEELLEQQTNLINGVRGIKKLSDWNDFFRRANLQYWYLLPRMRHLSFSKGLEMRIKCLRLVACEGGYLENILRAVQSPDLIWLRWYGCNYSSLPDWIPMKNLRVLEVDGTKLNVLWPHESKAVPFQLRELNIYAPLSEIPKSIGKLKYLESIAIWHPYSASRSTLKRLPDEFCNLLSLEYLLFRGFSGMVLLPDRFGELTNLQRIDLDGAASLQMLPNSFGNLQQLKHLSFRGASSLQMLPDRLGELTNLQHIDLDGAASLQMLPNSFGNLQQLEYLYLRCASSLQMLSDRFGELTNLEYIDLDGAASLQMLPNSFGNLQQLKHLSLNGASSLQMLPDRFEELTNLQRIDLDGASSLQMLPDSFGELTKLQHIELDDATSLQKLPNSFGNLQQLKHLSLRGASSLQMLPDRFGELTNLEYIDLCGAASLQSIPGVEDLTLLYILNAGECPKLQWSEGVVEQLRQRLNDGFIYEKENENERHRKRKRCGENV